MVSSVSHEFPEVPSALSVGFVDVKDDDGYLMEPEKMRSEAVENDATDNDEQKYNAFEAGGGGGGGGTGRRRLEHDWPSSRGRPKTGNLKAGLHRLASL